MKTLVLRKPHIYLLIVICLSLIFVNYIGLGYTNVFTASAAADKNKVRYELLLSAVDELGACSPTAAAEIWAKGVKTRNAAMQYGVLDDKLKAEYLRSLEQTAPNWVTGVSSPWIDSYEVLAVKEINEQHYEISLKFITASSTGVDDSYKAVIHIIKKDDYYVINKIKMDEGLYPYTGFMTE